MNRISMIAVFSVFAVAFPGLSAGQSRRPERCKQQIKEACQGVQLASGKLGKCIRQHLDLFTSDCRDIVQNRLPDKCIEDGKQVCPGLRLGDGKFATCMRQNFAKFSDECKFQTNSWYAVSNNWKSKVQQACETENHRCPGLKEGTGKWWTCLNANEDKVGARCKAFLQSDRQSN